MLSIQDATGRSVVLDADETGCIINHSRPVARGLIRMARASRP